MESSLALLPTGPLSQNCQRANCNPRSRSGGRVGTPIHPAPLTPILPPNGALSRLRKYRLGNCTFVTFWGHGNQAVGCPTQPSFGWVGKVSLVYLQSLTVLRSKS